MLSGWKNSTDWRALTFCGRLGLVIECCFFLVEFNLKTIHNTGYSEVHIQTGRWERLSERVKMYVELEV